jgi:hypothetical protein
MPNQSQALLHYTLPLSVAILTLCNYSHEAEQKSIQNLQQGVSVIRVFSLTIKPLKNELKNLMQEQIST